MRILKKISMYVLVVLCCISCIGGKNTVTEERMKKSRPDLEYEIHSTELITGQDTVLMKELRYYKIRSALDGMVMMQQNHGENSKMLDGKYQSNIRSVVWETVGLLGDGVKYFVIVDGTETLKDYFVSIMVFDDNQKNCLSDSHPNKNQIIKHMVKAMRNMKYDKDAYLKFRSN